MEGDQRTKTLPLKFHRPTAIEIADRTSDTRRTLEPNAPPLIFGSASDCDFVIRDPYVSGRHASIGQADGGIVVRDLGSKNGTYVGGARIAGRARIEPGALIRVGGRILEVSRHNRRHGFARLVGTSAALQEAVALARRAASSDCSVLILGETGTGKDVLARAIHDSSRVCAGPYVAINCGAIPRELVASELFGHVRGSFTGAAADRDGVFVQASGGTLFLDELGELPAQQQPHLLRVLETRAVTPVGGTTSRPFDTRIIAATNALDLHGARSPLRSDLYHRLATVVIEIPPLRNRRGDIPELVRHFMTALESRYGRRTIAETTVAALTRMTWPGNVRELRQAVHRATALCPLELTLDALVPPRMRSTMLEGDASDAVVLKPTDRAVRDLMLGAYRRYGTIRRAAASLGMAKSTFADRAHRYGILPKKEPP